MRQPNPPLPRTRPVRPVPPSIGRLVERIAKPVYKKFGFTEPHILAYWPDIVGPSTAKYAEPVKVSYPEGRQRPGVLTIKVRGPLALEIQHLEPKILERINGYYGFEAVGRLHLLQTSGRRRG